MRFFLIIVFVGGTCVSSAQKLKTRIVNIDSGWSRNSVNATVFRKNSIVSFANWQYASYYNNDGFVVLAKRKLNGATWIVKQTQYKGNVSDAHNIISIMVDGDGVLHMAWNHHNNRLHYVRSKEAGSLELTDELPMTGTQENKVSYPEFYRLSGGDLLFFYRDGESGNGSLVINRYDVKTKTWRQLQSNLIDGDGQRNAYWQACVDVNGFIHISWVWRETSDVASNHDLCYAVSKDGGLTWQKSTGEVYKLPITASSAEYAFRIPQKSELINQTSMFADGDGNPYIASYWREENSSIPQYHLVYKTNGRWNKESLDFRKTSFTLSGAGTKRIPISRPQIVTWKSRRNLSAAIVFRDEERGNEVSAAMCKKLGSGQWSIVDLTQTPVGMWEPSYDTELWKAKNVLHLFVQNVEQIDDEGQSTLPPQMVKVLEWKTKK